MRLKEFFTQFGFEPRINTPILLKLKSDNILYKAVFGLSRICGRLPFELGEKLFRPIVGTRIVEIPFVFVNLPKKEKMKILDFGCNESALSIELASLGHKVTGYDLQDYKFKHRNFTFYRGNFLNNKFKENEFDVVTAVSVVEHCGIEVYDSPAFSEGDKKIMEELRRVLKKDGVLLLTVPFGQRHKDKIQRIYDEEALKFLVSGFKVEKEQYFIRNSKHDEWFETTKEKANSVPYQGEGDSGALACLVCRKP